MNISVSRRNMELSKATKEYMLEKIEKLDRFFDRITDVKAILAKENDRYACEIIISVPSHQNIVIERKSEKLYRAIDQSINICERKLRQYKNKMHDRKGRLHDVP